MKRVVVEPEAEAELVDAATWYERQRAGLGARLVAAVDEALQKIAERPDAFARWRDDRHYRLCVLRPFPYVIFFVEESVTVRVVAIAHGRRRPGYWLARGRP